LCGDTAEGVGVIGPFGVGYVEFVCPFAHLGDECWVVGREVERGMEGQGKERDTKDAKSK